MACAAVRPCLFLLFPLVTDRGPYSDDATLIFNFQSNNDFVYGAFTHPRLVTNATVTFTSSFYTAYEVFTAYMPTPN